MKKIECVIADDEQLSRDILRAYIEKTPSLQLIAECRNGLEVFELIKGRPIDLLFLDIHMPMLTGIELLKTMLHPPRVILVTAYREYALEGYELNVMDYLLKPVSFTRFLKAVDKLREPVVLPGAGGAVTGDAGPVGQRAMPSYIDIKSEKKMVRVAFDSIHSLEGMKDYVRIATDSGVIITHQTLQFFEEQLPAQDFIRVHRSYIIPLKKVGAYSASFVEIKGHQIPIGAFYQRQVMDRLQDDQRAKG